MDSSAGEPVDASADDKKKRAKKISKSSDSTDMSASGGSANGEKKKKEKKNSKLQNSSDSNVATSGDANRANVAFPPPIQSPEKEEKRGKAAQELHITEVNYYNSICFCVGSYMKPLENSDILTAEERRTLFSNLGLIVNFHQEFLKEISERTSTWSSKTKVADVFLRMLPMFKMYKQYAANYERARVLVKDLLSNRPKFKDFISDQTQSSAYKGQQLAGFLIQPIQRIPRYAMLLNEIVKNTPSNHEDYEDLKSAVKQVQEMADQVDNGITANERRQVLMQVQTDMKVPKMVEPHRTLLKDGEVRTNALEKTSKGRGKKGATMTLSIPNSSPSRRRSGSVAPMQQANMISSTPPPSTPSPSISNSSSGTPTLGNVPPPPPSTLIPLTPKGTRRRSTSCEDMSSLSDGSREDPEQIRRELEVLKTRAVPDYSEVPEMQAYLCTDAIFFVAKRGVSAKVELCTTWVKRDPSLPDNCFELASREGTFLVFAKDARDRAEWEEAVESAIQKWVEAKHPSNPRETRDKHLLALADGEGWVVSPKDDANLTVEVLNPLQRIPGRLA